MSKIKNIDTHTEHAVIRPCRPKNIAKPQEIPNLGAYVSRVARLDFTLLFFRQKA